MKKILWTPILLIPVVGGILMTIGFNNFFVGRESNYFFEGGFLLIVLGVLMYSREKTKKHGDGKLIVWKRKK